jgi:hypothetical protein
MLVLRAPDRIGLNEIFEHKWFLEDLPEEAKSRRYSRHPNFEAREAHWQAFFRDNEGMRTSAGNTTSGR